MHSRIGRAIIVAAAVLCLSLHVMAQTDGNATFRVSTKTANGQYAPRHVLAIWVTDSQTNFVKTLKRMAATRIQYLRQWGPVSRSNVVDGITGATLNAHQTHTVTWNCRDTNGVVVPDGVYRFWVEFTEANAQGPWTHTNVISFTKGASGATSTPPVLANFTNMQVVYAPFAISPAAIPGRIEAEDYASYYDTTPENQGGQYRSDGVDIETCAEGGYDVGWTVLGEWLNYNVTIAAGGRYDIRARVSSGHTTTKSFHVEIDGANVSGTMNFNTGGAGWQSWFDCYASNILLSAGSHTLRIAMDSGDFNINYLDIQPSPVHEVAVAAVTGAALINPGSTVPIGVLVTNAGGFTESFTVVLTDTSAGQQIGSRAVSGVGARTATNVVFNWNTAGAAQQYHVLRGAAGAVAGETNAANNTNWLTVAIAPGVVTNTLVAPGSMWRYNDSGLDLHATPWKTASFYDGHWQSGSAQLGYGDGDEATTISYGANANDRHLTYYFRHAFPVDFLPASATVRVLRDDGVVVYANGAEAVRDNMPAGAPINYSTLSSSVVGGGDESTFYSFAVSPSLLQVGMNVLAAEVHQSATNSSDVSFDLELVAVTPAFPQNHDVAVLSVEPGGDAQVGDVVPVFVKVANAGNVTESFNVTLTDTNMAQVVGVQAVSKLLPQASLTLTYDWMTAGAAPGDHALRAVASAVSGETNVVNNAAEALGTISGTGFGLDVAYTVGGLGGFSAASAVAGSVAYVGMGSSIVAFDITDPANVAQLGHIRLPGRVTALAAAGTLVCAASGDAGVHIVDFSTPSAPVLRNTFNTSGHAQGVALAGALAYVADGGSGLRIVDLSNPDSPALVGSLKTAGPARAVAVSGSTACLLDVYDGLLVINVASPSSPALLGEYGGVRFGTGVAVSGALACVADENGVFSVIDISNPAAPVLSGSVPLGAAGRGLALNGAIAYVAAGGSGVVVVNASSPSAPSVVATYDTPGDATAVAAAGGTVCVADGFSGLHVVNAATPAAPSFLDMVGPSFRASDVVAVSNRVYVAAGESGLQIYDASNSLAPALLGACVLCSNARSVAVSGYIASVADMQFGLRIVDASNAASPALRSTYTDDAIGAVRRVAATGTRVVLTDGRVIQLLDVSDPAAPVLRDTYAAPGYVFDLAATPTRVVAAAGASGALVFDITNPASLAYGGSVNTPGMACAVSIAGDTAYVADGAGGWVSLDVSSAASPSLIGTIASAGSAEAVLVSGSRLLAGTRAGVRTFDIGQPLSPIPLKSLGALTHLMRMAVSGPYAFAAEDDAGLSVLDASPGDHDVDRMRDSWEQQIVDADPDDEILSAEDVRPGDDFDDDGQTNLEESIAGTDPTNPDSVFAISTTISAGERFVVRWHSVDGKSYNLYRTTNLLNGFSILAADVLATAPLNAYTDTVTSASAHYYMVGTRE